MKLTVTCQTCAKILAVVEKPEISQDDIANYQQSCSCDTVQSVTTDEDGNTVVVLDGANNIQTTVTR